MNMSSDKMKQNAILQFLFTTIINVCNSKRRMMG
ncbi:unknown [Prevotella sp. CAG:732]|nr:unknown [Prevotella sp. CAG:732]